MAKPVNFTQASFDAQSRRGATDKGSDAQAFQVAFKPKSASTKPASSKLVSQKLKLDTFDKSLFIDSRYVVVVSDEVDPAFPQHTQHIEPKDPSNPLHVAAAKAGQKNYDAHDWGLKVGVAKQFGKAALTAIKAPFQLIGLAGQSLNDMWHNGSVRLWDMATGNTADLKRIDAMNEAKVLQTRAILEHLGEIKDRIIKDPAGELAKKLTEPFIKHDNLMAQGKYYEAGEVMGRALASVPLAAFSVAFAIENLPATIANLQKVAKFAKTLPKVAKAGLKALPKGIGVKGGKLPAGVVPLSEVVLVTIKGSKQSAQQNHGVTPAQVAAEMQRRKLAKQNGGTDISAHNKHGGGQVYAQPTPANEFGDMGGGNGEPPVVKPVKKTSRRPLDRSSKGRKTGLVEKILTQVDKIPAKIGKPLLFKNWKAMSYVKRGSLLKQMLKAENYTATEIQILAKMDNLSSDDIHRLVKFPAAGKKPYIAPKGNYPVLINSMAIHISKEAAAFMKVENKQSIINTIKYNMLILLRTPAARYDAEVILRRRIPISFVELEHTLNYGGYRHHNLNPELVFNFKYENWTFNNDIVNNRVSLKCMAHEFNHARLLNPKINHSIKTNFFTPEFVYNYRPDKTHSLEVQKEAYKADYAKGRILYEVNAVRKEALIDRKQGGVVNSSYGFDLKGKYKGPISHKEVDIIIEKFKHDNPIPYKNIVEWAELNYNYHFPSSRYP